MTEPNEGGVPAEILKFVESIPNDAVSCVRMVFVTYWGQLTNLADERLMRLTVAGELVRGSGKTMKICAERGLKALEEDRGAYIYAAVALHERIAAEAHNILHFGAYQREFSALAALPCTGEMVRRGTYEAEKARILKILAGIPEVANA